MPHKICRVCKEEKDLSLFYKAKTCVDGHRHICKACDKIRKDTWRQTRIATHNEQCRLWAQKNPEKRKQIRKTWLDKNICYFGNRKRHVRQATPTWANQFYIEEIYTLAKLRTELTGIPWHVDHIIPLRGKLVCGLHVETNLRVIPALENLRKNNSYAETD